jgi:dolichyl-phosphate-mannose--protein O-mannosyl transferase
MRDDNDPNSLWMIKEAQNEKPCFTGRKMKCGETIRLEHMSTGKNLHMFKKMDYKAPLSGRQEVSGFGKKGEGDSGILINN